MREVENECVGCPQGCIHCGRDEVVHFYCDECGEEDVLRQVDNDTQLCPDCFAEYVNNLYPIVEGSDI